MRLSLPKLILLPLALIWLSCDQDLNSAKDQPSVDYVFLVTDSSTAAPLDSVVIHVTTITGDTLTVTTSSDQGRAQLPTLASSRTLFELSRKGYNTRDSIDTVNSPIDSVFHRSLARLLRIKMTRLGTAAVGRAQTILIFRDAGLAKLKKATVQYEDSTGESRIVSDTGETGSIGLFGLPIGKSIVIVRHPGYLGRKMEVSVDRVSDTSRVPVNVVTLIPLGNQITGQVSYATATVAKPLLGAKVIFMLKDSLAVPDTFITFTSGNPDGQGRFVLDSVPALDGQILYYKDRVSVEALKAVPILKEEVMQDGPLPSVTLVMGSDSTQPTLVDGPKDTLGVRDSLFFRFSQKVEVVDVYQVRLINQTQLLADTAWNGEHTQLKLWLKDAKWTRGKKYEYALSLRNGAGQYFTRPGDSVKVLRGIFSVPDSVGVDSAVSLPRNIGFAYFNSGTYSGFAETDSNTSPKADSSSQFARLKWGWGADSSHKADSLQIYYQDGGVTVPSWSLWGTAPGFADSVTLNFSDMYSTSRDANGKPALPFKTSGGRIYFRIVPKHAGKTYPDTSLDALEQAMGPQVYAKITKFNPTDSLNVESSGRDSLSVSFYPNLTDPAAPRFDWGANPPVPALYFNAEKNSSVLVWSWSDSKIGRVDYKLPTILTATAIRVDMNGVLYHGKPVWQRNPKNQFVLR